MGANVQRQHCEEITITGTTEGRFAEILTPEAVEFVVALDREFGARRVQLLDRRRRRRATRTTELDFLPSTAHIRADTSWTGQLNLRAALDGTIDFTTPDGKEYKVGPQMPTIMVRPRGWHLPECHVRIGGRAVSASLFDFGMYLFHCGRRQIEPGCGTTCSCTPRSCWASRAAPSGPPC